MSGRTWAAVIVAVVIVGAGAGYGGYQLGSRNARPAALVSSGSPLPSASRSPSATLGTTPITSPVSTSSPVAGASNLHCKLPVYSLGQIGSGGFISFPAGTMTPDAASNGTAPSGDWFGLTFDAAVNRWLPVPSTWVSPDGAVYAYTEDLDANPNKNFMVLVNALTGTGSGELGGMGTGWQVIGLSSTNIYAASLSGPGVYLQTITGPFRPTTISDGYWTAASGFYIFGSAIPDGGAIVRMDARDPTQRVPWFNKSGSAQILGFDGSGSPVIWTGSDLWIASAPDQATRIGAVAPQRSPVASRHAIPGALAPVADSHGLWFSTTDGIYLYAGGQTTKVSNLVAQVAGACI